MCQVVDGRIDRMSDRVNRWVSFYGEIIFHHRMLAFRSTRHIYWWDDTWEDQRMQPLEKLIQWEAYILERGKVVGRHEAS